MIQEPVNEKYWDLLEIVKDNSTVISDGCWMWRGMVVGDYPYMDIVQYPEYYSAAKEMRRQPHVHLLLYEYCYGSIDRGKVRRICKKTTCVNIEHFVMRPYDAEERFWSYVSKGSKDECWEWNGYITSAGYGEYRLKKKGYGAHRYSWTIKNGKIPKGLNVCHRCDVRRCVNPDHLFLGTTQENNDDMMKKGRWNPKSFNAQKRREQTHCCRGHLFSEENTYWALERQHKRVCKTCRNIHKKKHRDKQKLIKQQSSTKEK